MPDRPPLHIIPSYQGAASEFQHLYEVDEETVKKVQGHFKKKELPDWNSMLPRDNIIYHISETQNLRHLDQEMKEKFHEQHLNTYKSNRSIDQGSPLRCSMGSSTLQSPVNSRNKQGVVLALGRTGSQTRFTQNEMKSPTMSPQRTRDGFGLFTK